MHWTAFAVRYSTCQTPQAVWSRGSGVQVPGSLPCSQSMHMAQSQELEAASRSSETYVPGCRTVEADLRPFNLGLASGFKKARGQNYLARTHGNGYVTDKPRMMMMIAHSLWHHFMGHAMWTRKSAHPHIGLLPPFRITRITTLLLDFSLLRTCTTKDRYITRHIERHDDKTCFVRQAIKLKKLLARIKVKIKRKRKEEKTTRMKKLEICDGCRASLTP